MSEAQLQQDSPEALVGESTQLQLAINEELPSSPDPRAHKGEKRQKQWSSA